MQPRLSIGPVGNVQKNTVFINHWKADTTSMGSNNSLYHKLRDFGFKAIDSLYKNRPMAFWVRKGDLSSVKQFVESDSSKKLYAEFDFQTHLFEGNIVTDKIGPATLWSSFKRNGLSLDTNPGDSVNVAIYGINTSGAETLLANGTASDRHGEVA